MKNEDAIKLGFQSLHELIVYYDICLNLCKIEEYLKYGNKANLKRNYTKDECLNVINKYNLSDLINEVEKKDIYTRLVTIFLYYFNLFQLYKKLIDYYITKVREANELFDGEKIEFNVGKIKECGLELEKIRYVLTNFLEGIKYRLTGQNIINFSKMLVDMGFSNEEGKKL